MFIPLVREVPKGSYKDLLILTAIKLMKNNVKPMYTTQQIS